MNNSCYSCAKCANDAWDAVVDFLLHPPESVTRPDLERLKAYVRLGWRVEQNPDHDDAGWILQSLLGGGGSPEYNKQIAEFEEDRSVTYPRHLGVIQEIMERRCKVIEADT